MIIVSSWPQSLAAQGHFDFRPPLPVCSPASISPAQQPELAGVRPAPDAWLGRDKFDHVFVSAMLSSSAYLGLKVSSNEERAAFVSSLGMTIGVGAAKEIFDMVHPGHPSWKDLTADVLGAMAGALIARAL